LKAAAANSSSSIGVVRQVVVPALREASGAVRQVAVPAHPIAGRVLAAMLAGQARPGTHAWAPSLLAQQRPGP